MFWFGLIVSLFACFESVCCGSVCLFVISFVFFLFVSPFVRDSYFVCDSLLASESVCL